MRTDTTRAVHARSGLASSTITPSAGAARLKMSAAPNARFRRELMFNGLLGNDGLVPERGDRFGRSRRRGITSSSRPKPVVQIRSDERPILTEAAGVASIGIGARCPSSVVVGPGHLSLGGAVVPLRADVLRRRVHADLRKRHGQIPANCRFAFTMDDASFRQLRSSDTRVWTLSAG